MNQGLGTYALFGSVSRLVCGRNISSSPFTSGGTANRWGLSDFDRLLNSCSRFDNLRDQIQEKEDDSTKYKYDNTTSQECNDLIESMESSRAIRLVLISVQLSWI